jgi:hypothetical protein
MPPEASTSAPSAADFDQAFSASASAGIRRVALSLGDPGDDVLLADLQDEARQQLPLAGLKDRVVVVATAP